MYHHPSFVQSILSKEVEKMAKTKQQKKSDIRNQIITAAEIYQKHLVGKVFLFVFGNNYFEVVFQTDRFMHLTGVESNLPASSFYKKAVKHKLTPNQFFFTDNHPYKTVKTKLPCLLLLPQLTTSLTCVVQDFSTLTFTYKIGLTNLNFTLGLTENLDFLGNKLNDWFLPRTLRVNDNAVENSKNSEFIDFVFVKNASDSYYSKISYQGTKSDFPESICYLLDSSLLNNNRENILV